MKRCFDKGILNGRLNRWIEREGIRYIAMERTLANSTECGNFLIKFQEQKDRTMLFTCQRVQNHANSFDVKIQSFIRDDKLHDFQEWVEVGDLMSVNASKPSSRSET